MEEVQLARVDSTLDARTNRHTTPPVPPHKPLSNRINILCNKSSKSVQNAQLTRSVARALTRALTVGGAAEQCGRTKGRLSRERSDAGSNGLLNQTLAGGCGVFEELDHAPCNPQPLPPSAPPPAPHPPDRIPVCLCAFDVICFPIRLMHS